MKITKCSGEGQGSCKRCSDNGKWNVNWMCFLYKIEGLDGCYCSDCIKKIKEEKYMKLERKCESVLNEEYFSELTKELDRLAKFKENSSFKHYILADDYCRKEKCIAIRVPGGTVGGIWFDQDNVITKIRIHTDYVVKTYPYPENIEEIIQKYVGKKIDFR